MPPTALPSRASVVIIGGGVIGLSTAYHLARPACRDVVLVERAAFGSGSTCKAAGGVRAQFSDPVNIELGAAQPADVRDVRGQLRPGDRPAPGRLPVPARLPRARARRSSRTSRCRTSWACPAGCSSRGGGQALSPLIATDGLLAAASRPTDGHCTPESVVLGYAAAARRHGARLVRRCAVTAITPSGGVVTVDTEQAARSRPTRSSAPPAPGPGSSAPWWASTFRWTPLRRQILVTDAGAGRSTRTRRSRSTSAPASTSTARATGCCWACRTRTRRPGFRLGRSDDWLPGLGEAMERRTPALSEVGIAGGWAGLYEMTPDHNALVGEAEAVSRFLYATGFSGHGFLMGPAVGEVMRDLYLGRRPVVDVSALDARRFTGAGLAPSSTSSSSPPEPPSATPRSTHDRTSTDPQRREPCTRLALRHGRPLRGRRRTRCRRRGDDVPDQRRAAALRLGRRAQPWTTRWSGRTAAFLQWRRCRRRRAAPSSSGWASCWPCTRTTWPP